jgi:ATP synthase protein I
MSLSDDRPSDPAALDARLARAQASRVEGAAPVKPAKGYSQGSRVLAELIGAPIGGGIIGWALDRWFDTSPWLLLIFLTLAIVAAFRNIFKISKERAE